MKILFYVILELIFIIAAWFWGDLFFISMLKPGETCLTANYGINIGNYLALGWNNYFQWFSNIEQMPCRITFAAWCLYFLSCFPAYALLKVYGMFKLSITLKYKFVISEYILHCFIYDMVIFAARSSVNKL